MAPKTNPDQPANLNIRDIPRSALYHLKMAAAAEEKIMKESVLELVGQKILDLEKQGILPKGKWPAMQKAGIARHIHQHAGLSETESAKLLDCVLDLKTTLQEGEPIAISGFGKFTVRRKPPRTGRNPRTGVAVMISARRVVTFHPSLVFTTEVNSVPADRQEAWTHLPKGKGWVEAQDVDYRAMLVVSNG